MADTISESRLIEARAESIFAVLCDPRAHAAIDGTGWVRASADAERLTAAGQVFRMAMYHPGHPEGNYVTANRVQVFDPPNTVSWQTGYDAEDGTLQFGGWCWRYDLTPVGTARTDARLTYDWTAASEATRELIGFPPFPPEHLSHSLEHLSRLVGA